MNQPPRLVAFDVDGTLLRGETICECIGRHLGKSDEMKDIERSKSWDEIAAARRHMLTWYLPHGRDAILDHVKDVQLAPGARAAFARLHLAGIKTALVSLEVRCRMAGG